MYKIAIEKYQNQGCFYIAYDEFEKGFQYIKNVSLKGKNVQYIFVDSYSLYHYVSRNLTTKSFCVSK